MCPSSDSRTIIYERPTPTPAPATAKLPVLKSWAKLGATVPCTTTTKGGELVKAPTSPAWLLASAPTLTSCEVPASPSPESKAREPVTSFAPPPPSSCCKREPQWSLAWISCLVSDEFHSGVRNLFGDRLRGRSCYGRKHSPHYIELQNGAL